MKDLKVMIAGLILAILGLLMAHPAIAQIVYVGGSNLGITQNCMVRWVSDTAETYIPTGFISSLTVSGTGGKRSVRILWISGHRMVDAKEVVTAAEVDQIIVRYNACNGMLVEGGR